MGFDDSAGMLYITESAINEMKSKIPEDGNNKELSIWLTLKTNSTFQFFASNIKNISGYNPSAGKAILSNARQLGEFSIQEFKDYAKAGAIQIALLVK